MFRLWYLNFGKSMMSDLTHMKKHNIRVVAGYDGDMKMWWIGTRDPKYHKLIWSDQEWD